MQDSLLLLMLPALGEVRPPEGDSDARKAAFLGLKERPGAAREGEQTDGLRRVHQALSVLFHN